MAGSINKVILIGNLGKDPEIRRLESGIAVANFPIATSESYTDKSTGQKKEITDWHDIVLWRGLAELSEKYLKKGHKVYVEGRLKKRSWQDKEGNTRYSVEVVADNMTMLSKPTIQSQNKSFSNEGLPAAPSEMEINTKSSPDDFMPF